MEAAVPEARGLYRFALVTVGWAALVVFAGAMVTSTGSGMAVPDWPLSFGTWMPPLRGGVLFEHGHRMVAGTLGVLVLALAIWSAAAEPRRWARTLTWAALVAVLAQALLGGFTVLRGTYYAWGHTDPWISTAHAALAQGLLATLVAYATVRSPGWSAERRRPTPKGWAAGAAALVALVYLQIVVGAVMRHQNAGLAILGFPLNSGRLLPSFDSPWVAVNFAHRLGAWTLVLGGGAFAWTLWRRADIDPWARRPAAFFLGAVAAQFLLGATVVWTQLQYPVVTSLHVVGGAVLLATSVVLALRLAGAGREGA